VSESSQCSAAAASSLILFAPVIAPSRLSLVIVSKAVADLLWKPQGLVWIAERFLRWREERAYDWCCYCGVEYEHGAQLREHSASVIRFLLWL
jgi:hypothetical protein